MRPAQTLWDKKYPSSNKGRNVSKIKWKSTRHHSNYQKEYFSINEPEGISLCIDREWREFLINSSSRVVIAYVANNYITPDAVPDLIRQVYDALANLRPTWFPTS